MIIFIFYLMELSYMKSLLSLFSGCGGMDLGFEGGFEVPSSSIDKQIPSSKKKKSSNKYYTYLKKTNFKIVFANDITDYAYNSWINNFSINKGYDPSVFHKKSIVDLVKEHKIHNNIFPDNVDIVTGGFPCQDFSLSGKRNGFNSHKNHNNKFVKNESEVSIESRGYLYYWMREVISIVKPKIFIAENVKGLVSLSNIFETIKQDFMSVNDGYILVPVKVLNASDYGIAQNRERVIFIGLHRNSLKDGVEEKILTGEINLYPDIKKDKSSVKDFLNNIEEPLLSKDPSQQVYSKAKYCHGTQGQKEIDINSIAPTIRSEHHGNIEYRRLHKELSKYKNELDNGCISRRLTPRECALIQSFPNDFLFVIDKKNKKYLPLSSSGAYKVIGNAVPPLLAYLLANKIESNWGKLFKDSNLVS